MSGPPTVTRIARTVAEIEEIRVEWERVTWGREEAALDYFLARTHARPDVIAPFGVIISDEDGPQAALAGRIEHRKLSTSIGYRVVYAPRVRYLHVVDGGLIARDPAGVAALKTAIEQVLDSGAVDVVGLPPLELGSRMLEAFEAVGGPLGHQPLIAPWTRRRLVLPDTFEEFVASRSSNTRWRIRRDTKRLLAAIGDRLRVDIVRDPTGLEQLMRDASAVAQATYQHALGAGFADTPEQRALAEVGLEHGWVRGYLLYLDERPIAYWFCSTYEGTMLIRTAGYDAGHAAHRPGIYLLMRLIEDACSDPTLHTLDFGPGDAAYKQQFSSESVEERNLVLFAPTMRARRINLTRTAILAPVHIARRILDRTKLTERIRARWRGRLRAAGSS